MDAITLPTSLSLLKQLQQRYPALQFIADEDFFWRAEENAIHYHPQRLRTTSGLYDFFHELGHAVLGHQNYEQDIELLQMESEAWEQSYMLGEKFQVTIEPAYAQAALDSYRLWLAQRSTCPRCQQTGIQKTTRTYQCINCQCVWRVNEAKFCALRRYQLASS